jgi:replication fork clamp-binding protein CrfC
MIDIQEEIDELERARDRLEMIRDEIEAIIEMLRSKNLHEENEDG